MTTKVDEIAPGIYRLSTLFPGIGPSGLTFNQFLFDDDEPLLFHTGHHCMFPAVCAAIERVMPVSRLRWITFGHVESDECGAMNEFLAPGTPAAIERLTALAPRTLALMHGSSYSGDCAAALRAVAASHRDRMTTPPTQ